MAAYSRSTVTVAFSRTHQVVGVDPRGGVQGGLVGVEVAAAAEHECLQPGFGGLRLPPRPQPRQLLGHGVPVVATGLVVEVEPCAGQALAPGARRRGACVAGVERRELVVAERAPLVVAERVGQDQVLGPCDLPRRAGHVVVDAQRQGGHVVRGRQGAAAGARGLPDGAALVEACGGQRGEHTSGQDSGVDQRVRVLVAELDAGAGAIGRDRVAAADGQGADRGREPVLTAPTMPLPALAGDGLAAEATPEQVCEKRGQVVVLVGVRCEDGAPDQVGAAAAGVQERGAEQVGVTGMRCVCRPR